MLNQIRSNSRAWFLGGLSLGILFGAGMLVGSIVTRQTTTMTPGQLPPITLSATASHGSDSFAMATGPVSDATEGLFVLDYLTGDLQCFVMYSRSGAIGGQFKVNIVKDLGIQQGKKPNYLMVTGAASFPRGGGNTRPANCVVYVADANTGIFAAYSIPWNRAMETANRPQAAPMVLVGTGKARNLEIRE